MSLELRDEPATSVASRELVAQYVALVRARLAAHGLTPGERFYVDEEAFDGAGGAWIVAYEDSQPVGCGGLRTLAPGVGEVKRLFVAGAARGRGYGRALLHELEQRAAAAGHRRMRMVTAEVLGEASALYAAEGYATVARIAEPGKPVELEFEKALHS